MGSIRENYLWGAGSSAAAFLDAYADMSFKGVIETSPSRDVFRGLPVVPPGSVNFRCANITIASEFFEEIYDTAMEMGARPEDISNATDIALRDADAAVISYQKCGRTWIRLMLGRIFQQKWGLSESEIVRITESPRRFKDKLPIMPKVIFHHDDSAHRKTEDQLRRSKLEYFQKKVIFLCRDPRDVILSNYYHMTFRARRNELSKKDFIKKFLPGVVQFYNIWIDAKVGEFLLIRFEDMKRNTHYELQRILDFLNSDLTICESIIDEAIDYCSLDNMKKYEAENRFGSPILSNQGGQAESAKVRGGKIGGFKTEVDDELQLWCNEQIRDLDHRYGYL